MQSGDRGEGGAAEAAAGQATTALQDLPFGVLETICSMSSLEERVALTSCCRALWARQDVASNGALWKEVVIKHKQELSAGKLASLARWLQRRRPALRRLRLEGSFVGLQGLLVALEGGPLVELAVSDSWNINLGTGVALSSLSGLKSLACLDLAGCRLRKVPEALTSLQPSLHRLNLHSTYVGLGGCPGLLPLRQLTGLSSLDLSCCGLYRVPGLLSTLARLREVSLADNGLIEGEALLLPPSLTHVDLSVNKFHCVPPELAALPRLADLALGHNHTLGYGGRQTLEPLSRLAALSRLGLEGCPRVGRDLVQSLLLPGVHVKWGRKD